MKPSSHVAVFALLTAAVSFGACATDDPIRPSGDFVSAAGASAGAPVAGGPGAGAAGSSAVSEPQAGQGGAAGESSVPTAGAGGTTAQPQGGAAGEPTAAGAGGQSPEPQGGAGGQAPFLTACPEGKGPTMALIELPDTPRFCIDTTEVTQGQYATFIAAVGPTPKPKQQSRPICNQYNDSFLPQIKGEETMGCAANAYDPAKKADLPMGCVGICDAIAFCEWSGKRLCGSVDGGTLPKDAPGNSPKSQWYLACSQGGKTKFSTGDTLDRERCASEPTNFTPKTGAESTCVGQSPPFDSIKNLTGNVWEWEDGLGDNVVSFVVRGNAAWSDQDEYFACGMPGIAGGIAGGDGSPGIGFRCCADLAPK